MSEIKRKIIEHRLDKEINSMMRKYPAGVLAEVFKVFPTFEVLKYQVSSMIDDDMDPFPIMNHIEDYKTELFDAIMEMARTSVVLETEA